jgi:hypothetical protein
MSIITVILTLGVVGVLCWLVSLIPMDATIKKIITVAAIVLTVLWLLRASGVLGAVSAVHI